MELIRFPKVAENVTEGTVSRWLASVGDRVAREQSVVELITEKAEFELPSPATGRLAAVFAPERATVPVGYVLCILAEEGEAIPDVEKMNAETVERHQAALLGAAEPAAVPPPSAQPATHDQQAYSAEAAASAAKAGPATGGNVAASPAARRLAKENGVDLAQVARRFSLSRPVSEDDIRKFLASGRQ